MLRSACVVQVCSILILACSSGGPRRAEPMPRVTRPPSPPAAARVALPTEATAVQEPTSPPTVVVSELMVDPLLLEDHAGEYVELANMATRAVRLADLSLLMPSGAVVTPERPEQPVVHPGEVLLLTPLALAALAAPFRRTGRGRVHATLWLWVAALGVFYGFYFHTGESWWYLQIGRAHV